MVFVKKRQLDVCTAFWLFHVQLPLFCYGDFWEGWCEFGQVWGCGVVVVGRPSWTTMVEMGGSWTMSCSSVAHFAMAIFGRGMGGSWTMSCSAVAHFCFGDFK